MKTTQRWYVGIKPGAREAFKAPATPTEASHGHLYAAVMGPFRTKRAAVFVVQHGQNNPHIQHVRDAERIAKLHDPRRVA